MAETNIDWEAIAKELGAVALEGIKDLIDGAADDVRRFGVDIGRAMVAAIRAGDEQLETELKQQLFVLAEINRVRGVKESAELIARVLDTAVAVALKLLIAAGAVI